MNYILNTYRIASKPKFIRRVSAAPSQNTTKLGPGTAKWNFDLYVELIIQCSTAELIMLDVASFLQRSRLF